MRKEEIFSGKNRSSTRMLIKQPHSLATVLFEFQHKFLQGWDTPICSEKKRTKKIGRKIEIEKVRENEREK